MLYVDIFLFFKIYQHILFVWIFLINFYHLWINTLLTIKLNFRIKNRLFPHFFTYFLLPLNKEIHNLPIYCKKYNFFYKIYKNFSIDIQKKIAYFSTGDTICGKVPKKIDSYAQTVDNFVDKKS